MTAVAAAAEKRDDKGYDNDNVGCNDDAIDDVSNYVFQPKKKKTSSVEQLRCETKIKEKKKKKAKFFFSFLLFIASDV